MMKVLLRIAALVAVAACSNRPAATADTTQPVAVAAVTSGIPIKVYKTPTCGCCKSWVEHLQQNGFAVEVVDMPDLSAVKAKYKVGGNLESCHTALVDNYVVEGHVPADLILKMLKEKPAIAGLAVPGMPAGSPGMEGASKQPYDVLTFDSNGHTTVYASR
jgi:hypothetical protein